MKILVIDNNRMPESWGASDLVRSLLLDSSITVSVRRAPEMDLPPSPRPYDRIVISGSMTAAKDQAPWTEKHDQFLKQVISLKKPTLCVCYGHQALCRVLGSFENVGKSKTPEFGWTEIVQKGRSKLFAGLPENFYSYSSHFDEVRLLPKGAKVIASSADCAIQGVELEDAPIYGIQFHPEKSLEEGEKSLAGRKKSGNPKILHHFGEGIKYFDSNVGQKIFSNFIGLSS